MQRGFNSRWRKLETNLWIMPPEISDQEWYFCYADQWNRRVQCFYRGLIVKKKVLFVCTGNACRSQIAEGIVRYLANEQFEVFSAGTTPSQVHPLAIKVMDEWSIDISHHTSDHVDEFLDKEIDILITLSNSAQELCPAFQGDVEQLHWDVPDPFPGWVEDSYFLPKFREVRNIIRGHIDTFLQNH